jgi:predicted ATPase/DNA-binding CsgD family transcriptional regulator
MARPTSRPGNLPAEATSFIGRRRELTEVRKRLTEARLVTLAGPGGVGKTRLAVRIGAELGRGFRDGAWLVELADVGDPALVSHAVMAALDLRDQAAAEPLALLVGYLRDRDLLLVVDNCEHLIEPAARVVTDVLRAAPGVRVIATSREPLAVPGEHVIPVPPLELPAPDGAAPLGQLRQNEAVALFTQRAAAATGAFELTAANQAAVTDLCRGLDGLPLAIELAAVRTRVLGVTQIRDRLTDRFGLLTGGSRAALPRHQTLRATIEWSHELLTAGERAVLRRAAVFAGRFTLDDVEGVCVSGDVPDARALDVLAALVDKSLVMKEDVAGLACYRLHETMREFARIKLAEAGEQDAILARCTEYYRARCGQSALEGRYRLLDWLGWADLEIDNVRAVLQRCLARADAARGLDVAAALAWFWIIRATTEGMRWLEAFLAVGDGSPQSQAWAHFLRGFLAILKADPAAARPALREAVAAARRQGQGDLLTETLAMASIAANMAGDLGPARQLLAEAEATAAGLDYLPGTLAVLQARALGGLAAGDLAAVRSAAAAGVQTARAAGDRYVLGIMLLNLGCADLVGGDLDKSRPLLAEALRLAHQIDDRVDACGCPAALAGRARPAAQLMGAADSARSGAGANVMPFLAPLLAKAGQAAEAGLGAARFAAEFAVGQRLSRDEALDLAVGRTEPIPVAAPGSGVLGKREADVARLVADGLTNRQIGARLFISERTVDSHVRSILNKLGFSSRAQIAAWVAAPDR